MKSQKTNLLSSLSPRKVIMLFIILLLIVIVLFSCFSPKKGSIKTSVNPDVFTEATVTKIVDGDTLWLDLEDGTEKIRLIGIDAPERDYFSSTKGDGELSVEFIETVIKTGDTVYLQADITNKDDYSRLLRYVWIDIPQDREDISEIKTKMLNAIIIYNGYAEAVEYEPDVLYADVFTKLQKEAQNNNSGLWMDETTE